MWKIGVHRKAWCYITKICYNFFTHSNLIQHRLTIVRELHVFCWGICSDSSAVLPGTQMFLTVWFIVFIWSVNLRADNTTYDQMRDEKNFCLILQKSIPWRRVSEQCHVSIKDLNILCAFNRVDTKVKDFLLSEYQQIHLGSNCSKLKFFRWWFITCLNLFRLSGSCWYLMAHMKTCPWRGLLWWGLNEIFPIWEKRRFTYAMQTPLAPHDSILLSSSACFCMWVCTACLEPLRVVKKESQFLQRHLNVCCAGLVWSFSKCWCRCSITPKIRVQPCHQQR